MRQVLYLFISGFLAFLSCTQDKIQMVSLGIDDVYYLPRMKTYLLSPAFTGDEYRWTLHRNGTDSLVSTERSYIFLAKDTGTYQMTFEIIDKETPYKHDFRFEVMQEEIEYSPYLSKVYDFCPAPGQFVNTMPEYEEGDTKETILKKVEENISGTNDVMISLGGYGPSFLTFELVHSNILLVEEYKGELVSNCETFHIDADSKLTRIGLYIDVDASLKLKREVLNEGYYHNIQLDVSDASISMEKKFNFFILIVLV